MEMNGYIKPDWPAPSRINAAVSTRQLSEKLSDASGFDSFNIAEHVDDYLLKVQRNRKQLIQDLNLKLPPCWLQQNHGIESVELTSREAGAQSNEEPIAADASFTTLLNLPCVVMTADCLPILLTNRQGTWVSAIHAGWRGLCDGIIESTVAKYLSHKNELIAWLGPAISQKHFEVGMEVKQAFVDKNMIHESAFVKQKDDKYKADLYLIARQILEALTVQTFGGNYCTFEQADTFYSYRREAKTGRMASIIWIGDEND